VAVALVAYVGVFAWHAWDTIAPALRLRPPTLAFTVPEHREETVHSLTRHGDKALVFVRYSTDRIFHYEWVYNAADIDAAPVVWAREISPAEDQRLMDHFADRQVIRLDVTGERADPTPIRPPLRRPG
jgi:hypothetical protein